MKIIDIDPSQLVRRRDAAEFLGVSLSQMLKWENQGVITPIAIPGIRAKRYRGSDIRSLANNIAFAGRLSTEPQTVE
jgi:predicted site-specific integrase-resolvase